VRDEFAHSQRHAPTDAEERLGAALRDRRLGGFKFRRQHRIGAYVADFACMECMLAVEADGGQHADSEKDAVRTQHLAKAGWRVLRFWNHDILTNLDGVLVSIEAELRSSPSPVKREREGPDA
jgi:very-short-patch-repair endonuclease